ncbi:MAG: DUF2142 domain-containing protein [Ilumatobacteraceae bacterium]
MSPSGEAIDVTAVDAGDQPLQPVDAVARTDPSMVRRWLVLFLALFPLAAIWAVTNPMLASPDETLHIIRAQSIAAGDFSNPYTTDGLPIESIECFRFQPEVPAACQDLTWGADGTQRIAATDGYPPLYHALASVPAFFVSGLTGAYVMRLWMAAIVIAVVAWAGVLVTRTRAGPWPLTGFALAMTPMVVFVVSTVNPSGLAVASAMLFVAGVVSLCTSPWRGRDVTAAVVAGATGLALTRRDGLLWLAILAVVLTPVAARPLIGSVQRRGRHVVVAAASAVAVFVVVAAVWARPTLSRFGRNWQNGDGTTWWEAARYIRTYLVQAVGVFGWLDSPIGEEAFLIAMILAGFVALLGLTTTHRRLALSTGLAIVALLVTPVAFGLVRFPYLQGRYLLPIWVGALLIAGASASFGDTGAGFNRRAARLVLAGWAVVHLVAGIQNLRRYAVGRSGSWNFLTDADWHPDTMSNSAAVVAYVVAVAIAVVGFTMVLREVDPPADPPVSSAVEPVAEPESP